MTNEKKRKELLRAIGKRIRLHRYKLEFTQEEFAQRAGLHPTYIGSIERGERNMTINSLFQITIALGCRIKDLMPDD